MHPRTRAGFFAAAAAAPFAFFAAPLAAAAPFPLRGALPLAAAFLTGFAAFAAFLATFGFADFAFGLEDLDALFFFVAMRTLGTHYRDGIESTTQKSRRRHGGH